MRTQPKTDHTGYAANEDAARRRARKPKNDGGQWISEANAPAHEEFTGNAHRRDSTCLQTASNTVETSSSSKEGSGCSPRLYVVTACELRRTISFVESGPGR